MCNRLKSFLILIVMLISTIGMAFAEMIFYANFDQTLDAVTADGNRTGKWLETEKNPNYVPGKIGMGLATGFTGQAVSYNVQNIISSSEGTITFWVKAQEGQSWHNKDGKNHVFLELFGRNGSFCIKKQRDNDYIWAEFINIDSQKTLTRTFLKYPKFADEEWHYLGVTWKKGQGGKIYFDGILVDENIDIITPEVIDFLRFGQAWGEDVPNRIQDDLKIYSRALSKFDIASQHRLEDRDKNFYHSQMICVSKINHEIVIDGNISDDEWRGTARIFLPFSQNSWESVNTLTWVNLAYDNEYFYLAFDSKVPADADPIATLLHGIIKKTQFTRDTSVDADDSFDIRIAPFDPRNPDMNKNVYRMVVNGVNTLYDYSIGYPRVNGLGWNPDWITESQVDVESWRLEAKIPLAAFAIKPEGGDVWGISLTRWWRLLKTGHDGLTHWGYDERTWQGIVDSMVPVLFLPEGSVIPRIEDVAGINNGEPKITLKMLNSSPKPQNTVITFYDNIKRILSEEHYIIGGMGEKSFSFENSNYFNMIGGAGLRLELLDTDNGIFYDSYIPVYRREGARFAKKFYPSSSEMHIKIEIPTVYADQDLSGSIEIVDILQRDVFLSQNVSTDKKTEFNAKLDLSSLDAGEYYIKLQLENSEGKLVLSELDKFEKQPLPEWFGNDYGKSEKVPGPWVPLKIDNNSVYSWGREYNLGAILPRKIISQGNDLLTRPAYIEYLVNNETSTLSEGNVNFIKESDVRVDGLGKVDKDSWIISNNLYIEFDGMMWNEITIEAVNNIEIDKLSIVIPLKKQYSKLINPYDFALNKTGYLPDSGWSGSIRPLWLGNEDIGLQVFWENDKNWQPMDKNKEVIVLNKADEVQVRMQLIEKRVSLKAKEKVTFAFGMLATPVKQVPKYRQFRICSRPSITGLTTEPNVKFVNLWETRWTERPSGWNAEVIYPKVRTDLTSGDLQGSYADGREWVKFPYVNVKEHWAKSPEFNMFKDEWLVVDDKVINEWWEFVCPVSSYQDFFTNCLNELFSKAHVPGLYFDVSHPHDCANSTHDHSPGKNILATREMMKRIYTMMKEHDPNSLIAFHMSGMVLMPVYSFTDMLIDGENFASLLDRQDNRGYEKILTLDTFRAEYMGTNFGINSIMLPQFERAHSIKQDEWESLGYNSLDYLIGMVLLHDSLLWVNWFPEQRMKIFYDIFAQIGWDNSWNFIPYWSQNITQSLPSDEVVWTFYNNRESNRCLAIIFNATEKTRDLKCKLDFEKLGLSGKVQAYRLYPDNSGVNLSEDCYYVSLPGYSFELILFNK